MGLKRASRSGILITFEGIEGSGKTTQLRRLATLLRQDGYRVVETREPGGTPVAERIREILLSAPGKHPATESMTAVCEIYLILAARSQHVTHVIEPALQAGSIVLCDRFSDSTFAYQGYGRGLNLAALQEMNRLATGGLKPDLTLLFEVPVATGLARRRKFALEQNRLDHEAHEFHDKVRRGFLALAAREPERIKKIDGLPHPETVTVGVTSVSSATSARRRSCRRRCTMIASPTPISSMATRASASS
jgi:dTMP kinase